MDSPLLTPLPPTTTCLLPWTRSTLLNRMLRRSSRISSTTPKPSARSSTMTAPGGILMITEISAPILLRLDVGLGMFLCRCWEQLGRFAMLCEEWLGSYLQEERILKHINNTSLSKIDDFAISTME
ncbi:hypothetical protein L1987_19623 [Smallanthus sonchifolius]|uniref:Uncharacterized protein n=1 Tax=Smallanthus sonchifolius TaxID=185202 RepID=A0ACB9IQB7_9ASTR|nr:hypothetical protein L1987_19623 [Smallanthus sonchifolius]